MNARPARRRRLAAIAVVLALGVVVLGCDSEQLIGVDNTSSTQLRVFVKVPGGGISSVTPTPGNSSYVDAPQVGSFYAFAIIDADWLETVRIKRDFLQQKLANTETLRALSQDDLSEITSQINSFNDEIRRATDNPWSNVGGCTGELTSGARATITITDNPVGGFPAYILICASGGST